MGDSETGALRVAALQAMVASRQAHADADGALDAADALVAGGAPGALSGYSARVYLLSEGGREAEALAALAEIEAGWPGSAEADLARAHLGLPALGRVAGSPEAAAPETVLATAAGGAATDLRLSVHPNPAVSGATLALSLPAEADVTVTVYDLLGRAVAVPVAGSLAAGEHRVALATAGLAPGVYVVRMAVQRGAGETATRTARLTVAR